MMDEKAAPIQHITYNSNKYEHFNNSDEDEDRNPNTAGKPWQLPPFQHNASLPPARPPE